MLTKTQQEIIDLIVKRYKKIDMITQHEMSQEGIDNVQNLPEELIPMVAVFVQICAGGMSPKYSQKESMEFFETFMFIFRNIFFHHSDLFLQAIKSDYDNQFKK